jgi:hypothetical protein
MVCAEHGLIDRLAGLVYSERATIAAELCHRDASLGQGDYDQCALLPLAARGDLEAQRHAAVMAAAKLHMPEAFLPGFDPVPTVLEAVSFARLAAAQGDGDDRARVATLLSLAATFTRDGDYAAEALAWLELLADEGHEFADVMIADEAGNEPREVLAAAKEIHAAFVRFGVGESGEND